MKYLVGKDYEDQLCKKCCAAISRAHELITTVGADGEYTEDVEGPNMYAYDHGWFCGKYEGCINSPISKASGQELVGVALPKTELWVIAIWKSGPKQDEFLPIATSREFWPIHGGTFDIIGEQLGWKMGLDPMFRVGGVYYPPKGWNTTLVCLDAIGGEPEFFSQLRNPVSLLPAWTKTGDFDPADWGMS